MKICLTCEGISATDRDQCGTCGTPLLPTDAVHYPLRRGEEDSAHPLLGTRLDGKFRISSVLGRGGMGTVFRGVHEVSLVPVALKLLHPRYGSRPEYREAFLAEARKAGRVVHDHCARILDVGEAEDGTIYIAMELAEGETLDEWIQGEPRLPPATVVDILIQICRALVAAHAAGLVHRDLSTRNVMVSVREGAPFVKILDFGIAKAAAAVAREGAPKLASEPAGFANPAYSAPEHLEGRAVDARADLYSLGVIAYQALTGELPVQGGDARETAQNTLAGRLQPLPALPGVPRRLQRLVRRLLARDPAQRPASAEEVLAELLAIRARARSRLARVAPVSLLIALGLLVISSATGREPFLTLAAGSSDFDLVAVLPRSAPTRTLQSQELRELHFQYGGFRPDNLTAELYRSGTPLLRRTLEPVVDEEAGRLTLSAAQPTWREVVSGLQQLSEQGPVDLQLTVPGLAVLGAARLQVDDLPPELSCELPDGDGQDQWILAGDTVLDCEVRDLSGVDQLQAALVFERPAGPGPARVQADLPLRGGRIALGALLQSLLPGSADRGPGSLRISARDRAGNTAEWSRDFAGCDPAAPAIRSVTSAAGGSVVLYSVPRAVLRLQLDEAEPALALVVVDPDGREQAFASDAMQASGPWLTVALTPANGDEAGFRDGVYEFRLRDRAGNTSTARVPLLFRSRRVEAVIAAAEGQAGHLAVLGELLVTDGSAVTALFSCSDAYRPGGLLLRAEATGRPPPAAQPGLSAARAGAGTLALPRLEPGRYRLHVLLEDATGAAAPGTVEQSYPLRVLPEAVVLRLPPVAARFLPPLVDAGLLRAEGGLLRAGFAWRLQPDDARLVRGRAWLNGLPLAALPAGTGPGAALLPPFVPANGYNELALLLEDVLGRPVQVLAGDGPAPAASGPAGAVRIAGFWFHEAPPAPVDPVVRLEYSQDSRLAVHCRLPFSESDRDAIRLSLAQTEVVPSTVRQGPDGGSVLEFVLPFPLLVGAANLSGLAREDYGSGIGSPVQAPLSTPAGRSEIEFTVVTSRSTLSPVVLEELAAAELPGALADLRLLPVLAPEGEFADPVPRDLEGRPLFRPQPAIDVRGIRDFYLQDRECTRAQYDALLAFWRRLPAADRPDWQRLVHAGDPRGEQRLSEAGLLPAWSGADPARWRSLVEAGPERPVTGVDWYQAWTATRLLGLALAGDPELLRLPLGCELELAALGQAGQAAPRLQGAAASGGVDLAGFLAMGRGPDFPTATEERAMGDAVPTAWGQPFCGLDFGVREWVADLPYGPGPGAEVVSEWLAQHHRHLEQIHGLAAGRLSPGDLGGRLLTVAVLRGLAAGERTGLIDGTTGRPLPRLDQGSGRLPPSVPGVVRTEHLRRDGGDLTPGALDPRLRTAGFRVAGGEAFVARVRQR